MSAVENTTKQSKHVTFDLDDNAISTLNDVDIDLNDDDDEMQTTATNASTSTASTDLSPSSYRDALHAEFEKFEIQLRQGKKE